MHTLMVMYHHPTDPTAFRDHYTRVHLPLATALPGVRAARYTLDVNSGNEQSPIFAVFEADFDSRETMVDALSTPEGKAAQDDVPNFATGGVDIIDFTPLAPR